MYVCVLLCSVWDALTDNYISTWDGSTSEGLNGNLSDQEVQSLHIFLFDLHLGNVLYLFIYLFFLERLIYMKIMC